MTDLRALAEAAWERLRPQKNPCGTSTSDGNVSLSHDGCPLGGGTSGTVGKKPQSPAGFAVPTAVPGEVANNGTKGQKPQSSEGFQLSHYVSRTKITGENATKPPKLPLTVRRRKSPKIALLSHPGTVGGTCGTRNELRDGGGGHEEPRRRQQHTRDILAGIAASATGDAIDPTSLDDFDPAEVAADTAQLLDRQTADNQARWEVGRGARSAPDGPADNPLPDAADTQAPSHPELATALDAIRQAWPKATVLPAETKPSSSAPGPSFEAMVERLAAALMVPRPWQRVVDPARARGYFTARARHMLSRARDPLAEVEREEQVASQFAAPHTASKEHASDD